MTIPANRRALIIENDETLREYFGDYLKEHGFEVLLASDGVEGVVSLLHEGIGQVDFVLMELVLPHLNGLNALRIIKEWNPNIPVVATTGYADNKMEDDALERGADIFRWKPFKVGDVLAELEGYLLSPQQVVRARDC